MRRTTILSGLFIFVIIIAGVVYLGMLRSQAGPGMDLGEPQTTIANATWPNGLFTYPSLQKIPITLHCPKDSNVTLSLSAVPVYVWAKLVPQTIPKTTPGRSTSSLVLAGAIMPAENYSEASNMTVTAYGCGNAPLELQVPYLQTLDVIVLHTAGPIALLTPNLNPSETQNTTGVFTVGMVYDPESPASATIPVSFTVTGLLVNGTVAPLPPWLTVSFLQPSAQLESDNPFYLNIVVNNNAAPLGNYTLAIGEDVGGGLYSVTFDFEVMGGIQTHPA